MKGIVFTEFLEMVEQEFGLETVDHIINNSTLKSNGIYSSIGTYDFVEMQQLLTQLSMHQNIPIDDLIYAYGRYFFKVLLEYHPDIFNYYSDPFSFIASIESHIHVEVKKIYPDAELPSFTIVNESKEAIEIDYFSERAMYMFAKALIEKTFEHFHQSAQVKYTKLNDTGTQVKFLITLKG